MAIMRINTGLAGRPHLFLSLLLLPQMFNYIDSTAGAASNKVAIFGETVEIECSSGENSIDMMKWELIVGSKKVKVYIGKNPNIDFADRFLLSYDGLRSYYNLIIRNIQKEDAGTYICRDRDEKQELYVSVDLTILETSPICNSTNIARVSIADNSCGWPSDYLYLTCKVKYIGNIAPVLVWKDIDGKDVIRSANDSGVVSSTIKIKSVWNQFTFTCQANQLPQNPCYIVIPKPFYAFSSNEERTVSGPQRVSCSANSSHACQYRWVRGGEEVSTVQHWELESNTPPGDYQCVARCPFQEKYCAIPTLLIHYQASSCSHGWSVGLVFGTVTVTLIFVFVILGISFSNPSLRFGRFVEWNLQIWARFRKRFLKSENTNDNEETELLNDETSMKVVVKHRIHGRGKIRGITVLDSIIYVARHQGKEIEKYLSVDAVKPDRVTIPGLQEPRDLASCPQTKALYISDSVNNGIYKHTTDIGKTEKWKFTTAPEGISVLPNTDVVVVFQSEGVIRKFDSHGKCFETYVVPDGLINPHYAIIKDNCYLLCFGETKTDEKNGICIVNLKTSKIVETFNGENMPRLTDKNSNSSQMWPTRMARMANGNIIVVALKWDKILLLDAKLKFIHVLLDLDNRNPSRMFWDEANKKLYITECMEDADILICDETDSP